MKKEYVKPKLRLVEIDSSEVICGSVYLDDQKSADLWIYDGDGDQKVDEYDPSWGSDSGSDWQLW